MKGNIFIEIEHVKYRKFIDFDNLEEVNLILTPIKENQDTAILRFFYKRGDMKQLIKEVNLDLIPGKTDTEIFLDGIPSDGRVIDVNVRVDDGETIHFRFKRPLNLKLLYIPLASAAAVALFAIFAVPAIINGISKAAEKNKIEKAEKAVLLIEQEKEKIEQEKADKERIEKEEQVRLKAEAAKLAEGAIAAVVVKTEEDQGIIIPETVSTTVTLYFKSESAVIRSSEKKVIDKLINEIGNGTVISVSISGHTAAYHSEASRKEISDNRVNAVNKYLKSEIDDLPNADTDSYGSKQTVSTSRKEEYLDRRAEITIDYTK